MSILAIPAFPPVKSLSREQRQALMLDLVKAWFDDAGWAAPFVVRDGDKILGMFKPVWERPEKASIADVPPEILEQMTRRCKEIVEDADLLTTDEFLSLAKSELDRTPQE